MVDYSNAAINYGISDSINGIEDRGNGYYVIADDCNYYIPKNCSETTNGIIFYHGAGGWEHDTERLVDHIEGNIDSVIIFPKEGYSFNYDHLDDTNAELSTRLENIMNKVGADTGNVSTVTFSAGEVGGIQGIAHNIELHPEIKGQVCVLVDPKADDTGYGGERLMYNDNSSMKLSQSDTIRLLAENEATLIVYEQEASLNDPRTLANYERFASAGVNVIMIGGPSEHVAEFQNALDKNMLAYMSGDYSKLGSLESSKMIKYDSSTGTWIEASTDDIVAAYDNQKNGMSNNRDFTNFNRLTTKLKGIADLKAVTGDQQSVVSSMNSIRHAIKATSLLSNIKSIDCESTTSVPKCAMDFLYDYFSGVLKLLNQLENETRQAIQIGNEIEQTDIELTKEVENVTSSIYVPPIGGNGNVNSLVSPVISDTAQVSDTNGLTSSVIPDNPQVSDINPNNSTIITKNTETSNDIIGLKNEENKKSAQENLSGSYDVETLLNKNICDKVYNITADDLNKLFKHWAEKTGNYDSPLLGTGESWIKACNETGLDPLTLVGICGKETGRGGSNAMAWMSQKNFFGMKYIDPSGDGTGRGVLWGGKTDLFNGDVDAAIMQSAKRIKNFYYGQHGGSTMARIASAGYSGDYTNKQYAYDCASIMKESLDYITGVNGSV